MLSSDLIYVCDISACWTIFNLGEIENIFVADRTYHLSYKICKEKHKSEGKINKDTIYDIKMDGFF